MLVPSNKTGLILINIIVSKNNMMNVKNIFIEITETANIINWFNLYNSVIISRILRRLKKYKII